MAAVEHDIALLHHCYYVGEFDAGRRAAERLLAQTLTPEVEQRVRANRTFYTQTLAELGPVEFRPIDIKPARPDWSLFNPTLLWFDNKLFGLVRSSNYKMEGMRYIIPPEDGKLIRTQNILVTYDANFRITSAVPLADPNYEKTSFPVDGLEDCRLYFSGADLCVSATLRNCAPHDGRCRIGTAKIDLASNTLRDLEVLETPAQQHEKNWMPVIGQNYWLYSCNSANKTLLARRENAAWKLLDVGTTPALTRSFRGGTQLVPFSGGYLCAIHEVTIADNNRTYEHRFVWFDAQLRLRKVGAPFYFRNKRRIEFAAGLAVVDDRVVLSFGCQDAEAWLAIIPTATVKTYAL